MKSRFGGKFGSSHSTLTDAGAVVADIAAKCDLVKKVVHGPITTHRGSSGSSRRVKITPDGHALKVSVTANASHQILFVYTDKPAEATSYIQENAQKRNFNV